MHTKLKLPNDGFHPSLVENALFQGKYEMPYVRCDDISDVDILLPFDKRNVVVSGVGCNGFIVTVYPK